MSSFPMQKQKAYLPTIHFSLAEFYEQTHL